MQTAHPNLAAILQSYRTQFEAKLQQAIGSFGPPSPLRDACVYALTNGGKRFRPALVMMIAKALDPEMDASDAALAIECAHTASLIADDLPCMDDDDERRDKPSLHKAFGEATALLASYALIAESYALLCRNAQKLKARRGPSAERAALIAIENASANTGIHGAAAGQQRDLFPPDNKLQTLLGTLQLKTAVFFEIAFVFGWLFGGGDPDLLETVKKASANFGMAFQIADDLQDVQQDKENGCAANIALLIGIPEAKRLFETEIYSLQNRLDELNLHSEDLLSLIELMRASAA
jgi:geranylgeranyl diphosphate synthase type II